MSQKDFVSLFSELAHVAVFHIHGMEEDPVGVGLPGGVNHSVRWSTVPPHPELVSATSLAYLLGETKHKGYGRGRGVRNTLQRSTGGSRVISPHPCKEEEEEEEEEQVDVQEAVKRADPILRMFYEDEDENDDTEEKEDDEEEADSQSAAPSRRKSKKTMHEATHGSVEEKGPVLSVPCATTTTLMDIMTRYSSASSPSRSSMALFTPFRAGSSSSCSNATTATSTTTTVPAEQKSREGSTFLSTTINTTTTINNNSHAAEEDTTVEENGSNQPQSVKRIKELSALLAILRREPQWYQSSYAYEVFMDCMECNGLISALIEGLLQSWEMWHAGKDCAAPDCLLQLVLLHAEALVFYLHHRTTILRDADRYYFTFGCASLQAALEGNKSLQGTATSTTPSGSSLIERLHQLLCQTAQELLSNTVAQRVALLVVSFFCLLGEEVYYRTSGVEAELAEGSEDDEDLRADNDDLRDATRQTAAAALHQWLALQDKIVDHFHTASPRVAPYNPLATSQTNPNRPAAGGDAVDTNSSLSIDSLRCRLVSHFTALALLQCATSVSAVKDGGADGDEDAQLLMWQKLFPVLSQGTMYDVDLTPVLEQDGPDASLVSLVKTSLGRTLGRVWEQVHSARPWWSSFSLPSLLSICRAATVFSFAWNGTAEQSLPDPSRSQYQQEQPYALSVLSRGMGMPSGMVQLMYYVQEKLGQLCTEAVLLVAAKTGEAARCSSAKTMELLSYLTLYAYLAAACTDALAAWGTTADFEKHVWRSSSPHGHHHHLDHHSHTASLHPRNWTPLESLFVVAFSIPDSEWSTVAATGSHEAGTSASEGARGRRSPNEGAGTASAASSPSFSVSILLPVVLAGLSALFPMPVTTTSVAFSPNGKTVYVCLLPQYLQHLQMMVLSPHFNHLSSISAHAQTAAAYVQASCTLLCSTLSSVHSVAEGLKDQTSEEEDDVVRFSSAGSSCITTAICQRLESLAETNLLSLLLRFFTAYVHVSKPDIFLVAQLFTCVEKYHTFFSLLNVPGEPTPSTAMLDSMILDSAVFDDLSGQQVSTSVSIALLQTHLFGALHRSLARGPTPLSAHTRGGVNHNNNSMNNKKNAWYDFEHHCHHHELHQSWYSNVLKRMLHAISQIRLGLLTYQSSALTVYLTVIRQLYELSMDVEHSYGGVKKNLFLPVLQREAKVILSASPDLVAVLMEAIAVLQRQCRIGRLYGVGGGTIHGALTFSLQVLAVLTSSGNAYDMVASSSVPVVHHHSSASSSLKSSSTTPASTGSAAPLPIWHMHGMGSLPGLSVLLRILFSHQTPHRCSSSAFVPFTYATQRLCAEIWCGCLSKSTRPETFHTIRLSLRSSGGASSPATLSSMAVQCLSSGMGHQVNIVRLRALMTTLHYDYRLFVHFISGHQSSTHATRGSDTGTAAAKDVTAPSGTGGGDASALPHSDMSDLRLVKALCELITTTREIPLCSCTAPAPAGCRRQEISASPQEKAFALDLLRDMGLSDAVSTNAVSKAIRCSASSVSYLNRPNHAPRAPLQPNGKTAEKENESEQESSTDTADGWFSSETTSTYLAAFQAASASEYINAMLQRRRVEEMDRSPGTPAGRGNNASSTPIAGGTPRGSRGGSAARGMSMLSTSSGGTTMGGVGGATKTAVGKSAPLLAPIALPNTTSSGTPGVTDLLQTVLESGAAHMRQLEDRISLLFPSLPYTDTSVNGCGCVTAAAGVLQGGDYLRYEAAMRHSGRLRRDWWWQEAAAAAMVTEEEGVWAATTSGMGGGYQQGKEGLGTGALRCPLVLGEDFCFQPGTTLDDAAYNVAASLLYTLSHLCVALDKTVLLYTQEALDSNIARSQRVTELMVVVARTMRAVLRTGAPLLSALQSQSVAACLQLAKTLSTIVEQMHLNAVLLGEGIHEEGSVLPYAPHSNATAMAALTDSIRYLALVFLPAHQHLLPVVTQVLTTLRPFGLKAIDHHVVAEEVIAVLANQMVKSMQRVQKHQEVSGKDGKHSIGSSSGSTWPPQGEVYPPKLVWQWEDAFFEEAHLFMIQHGGLSRAASLQTMTVALIQSVEHLASCVSVAGASDIWVSRCTGRLHFLQTLLHQHPSVQGYISKSAVMALAMALGQLWCMPPLATCYSSTVLPLHPTFQPCAAQEVWCAVLELLQSILTCGGYHGAFRASKTGWLDAVMPLCLTPRLRWALSCFSEKGKEFILSNAVGSSGDEGRADLYLQQTSQSPSPPLPPQSFLGWNTGRFNHSPSAAPASSSLQSSSSEVFLWDVQECHLAMQLVSSLAALGGFMETTIPCVILGFHEVQSTGFLLHVAQVSGPSSSSPETAAEERERIKLYTCQIIRDALSFLVLQPSFLMPLQRFISSSRSTSLTHAQQQQQWVLSASATSTAAAAAAFSDSDGALRVSYPAESYLSFLVLYRFIARLLQSIQRSPGLLSGLQPSEEAVGLRREGGAPTTMLGLLTGANGKPLFAALADGAASPRVGASSSGSRSPSMDALSMITENEDFPLGGGGNALHRSSSSTTAGTTISGIDYASRTAVTAETLPLYMESVELALSVFMRGARAAAGEIQCGAARLPLDVVEDRELSHEVHTAANNLAYTLSNIEKGLEDGGAAEILIPFVKSRRRQIQKILSSLTG